MANRHLARTIAMQTLFCWDFNGQKDQLEDLVKESFQQFAPEFDDHGFVNDLVKGVVANLTAIDNYIVKNLNKLVYFSPQFHILINFNVKNKLAMIFF